ncbi:MAG: protein kinase, partial [Acidobacteriota bacterium]
MIGSSLGPYKILEQLGAGGMGEVWLAEDTRLNRKVAVKVLPPEFAVDRERLARFEQEAKAAAALNHPHIAAVFDVGSEVIRGPEDGADDGAGEAAADAAPTHFMVQEYLDGSTLRHALNKGALPLAKALLYAREIAEALGAAHGAGIVHRDLKPDNVFITKDGHAKVLDFGLAKLTELHGPEGKELSMSPTVLGTVAGQVMGTAGYMSPEQIESDVEIDGRADLFAFGCLLYEMSGGKRAFGGDSVLDTLHAIARTDPQPVGELNPELPADLERVIKKCLAKDRDKRYQNASDVLVDLKTLASEVEAGTVRTVAERNAGVGQGAAVTAGIPWRIAVPAAAVVALVAVLGTWMLAGGSPGPAADRIIRFDISLPEDVGFTALQLPSVAISPDGERIAVTANDEVWVRALDDTEATPVRGTEGQALVPFFSPDGQSIGFWAQGELRKVSIGGGAAVKLTDLDNPPFGATWNDDNTILYAADGIWRVSADAGEPEQLIEGEQGYVHGAQLLPDGSILYTLSGQADQSWDDGRVVVQRPDEAEPTVLVNGGRDARYLPTGHLVYALEDAVLARTYDPATRAVGGAVPLLQGVMGGFEVSGASHFATSATGDLVYVPGEVRGLAPSTLVWRDENGVKEVVAQ